MVSDLTVQCVIAIYRHYSSMLHVHFVLSIAVIAVWPVFLYGNSNIGVFGSPFTEGGTIGNQ
jgi:hypothetical protein